MTMSKRYTIPVEEDEHGDCFITLPDELLDEAGWVCGDELEYTEEWDGSFILRKVADSE